jgi:hypothetical protein
MKSRVLLDDFGAMLEIAQQEFATEENKATFAIEIPHCFRAAVSSGWQFL